jgi:hypothetical protein
MCSIFFYCSCNQNYRNYEINKRQFGDTIVIDSILNNDVIIDDLIMEGIGSISKHELTTYYIVCKSNKINDLRKSYNLNEKDLHITIGFTHKDLFHDRKNICVKVRKINDLN